MSLRPREETKAAADTGGTRGTARAAAHGAARSREAAAIDRLVYRVLAVGLVVSAALLVTGMVVWAVHGGRLPGSVAGPWRATRQLVGLQPEGFFSLGLLALILTPVVRVAGSVAVFAKERDWRYVLITSGVLAAMIAGLVVGAG